MELKRASRSMDIVIRRGKIYPGSSRVTRFIGHSIRKKFSLYYVPLPPLVFSIPLFLYIYIYIFPSSVRSTLCSWTARRMDDQFPCSTSLATSFNNVPLFPMNEKKIYVTYNWYRRSPLLGRENFPPILSRVPFRDSMQQ